MRVGLVSKGLILKGDQQLELVLLCATKPTVAMLKDVAEKLRAQLEVKLSPFFFFSPPTLFLKCLPLFWNQERLPGTYTVSQCPGDAAIAVTSTRSMLTLTIYMTSPIIRTEEGGDAAESAGPCRGVRAVSGVCVLSLQTLCRSTDLREWQHCAARCCSSSVERHSEPWVSVCSLRSLDRRFVTGARLPTLWWRFCLFMFWNLALLSKSRICMYLMLNSVHWLPTAAKLTIKIIFRGI